MYECISFLRKYILYIYIYMSVHDTYLYIYMLNSYVYTCNTIPICRVFPSRCNRGKAADNSEWPCRSLAAPQAYTGGILALPRMIPNLPKLRFQCADMLCTIGFGEGFPILDRRILGGTDVF